MSNNNPSDFIKPVLAIQSANHGAGTTLSAAIDTRGFEYAMIVVDSGAYAGPSTNTITVTDCATSGGSYVAITGAAFTVITASTDESINVGCVRLHGKERFIKTSMLLADGVAQVSITVLLCGPGSSADDQSVTYDFDVA